MHNNISKQISIAQEEMQQVLIQGDFNAKVGTYIEGNKPTVTKGGRQLMKMAKKYDLVIINKEKEVCKGLWTRVQGQERSLLQWSQYIRFFSQRYFSRFRVSFQRSWRTQKKVSFQRGFACYLLAISSTCAASRNFYDLRLSQVLAQRV